MYSTTSVYSSCLTIVSYCIHTIHAHVWLRCSYISQYTYMREADVVIE